MACPRFKQKNDMIDENRIKQEIDKQIKEAAERLINTHYGAYYNDLDGFEPYKVQMYNDGFKDGAHWAINKFLKDLWHDANEEPRKGEKLLGFDVDGFSVYCWTDQEPTWQEFVYNTVLQRWLYISDLFPKGGEK